MHKVESVQENEMHKNFSAFEMETYEPIKAKREKLDLTKKKEKDLTNTWTLLNRIIDFSVHKSGWRFFCSVRVDTLQFISLGGDSSVQLGWTPYSSSVWEEILQLG